MPVHAVLGLASLALGLTAALLALVYAATPVARGALRWPLVVLSAAAMVVAYAAGHAGASLLTHVEEVGSAAEVAAAQAHAHGSDAVSTAVFFLLAATHATVWGTLRPARDRWTTSTRLSAAALVAAAAATLITAGVVLAQALHAVSVGHPSWHGV